MKREITALWLLSLIYVPAVLGQSPPPPRTDDVIWARDVAGDAITFDGVLDEAVWGQAVAVPLQWDNPNFYVPGGGWDNFFGNLSGGRSPEDPADATAYFLRDGNILWVGLDVNDASVGANAADFWLWDGLTMSITNKTRRGNPEEQENFWTGWNTDEFFFSWHDRYGAGDMPRLFGNLGDDRTVWDGMAAVNGTTNDEIDVDQGYTMEVWIDVSKLGFDFTSTEGDRLPMTFSVYDNDFTGDAGRAFLSRAWWQNPWGGDMPWGTGFVYGSPGVTVSSAALPQPPVSDLTLSSAPDAGVTVDGELDEGVWEEVDPQIALKYQMTAAEMDELPGFGPYYTSFYRPGGGENAPPVIDPSTGRIRLFFEGSTLFVGLDTDDQAISGDLGEDRTDGLRVILRSMERDTLGLPFVARQFRVAIDSSGQAVLLEDAADNPGVTAAVHLKGASTAADPSDIDEGYQIEMTIDLTTLAGYESGMESIIWLAAVFFDADYLDPEEQSTFTRTWYLAERGSGSGQGPGIRTLLDADRMIGPGAEFVTDRIWAKDVEGSTIVFDGSLNEAVWNEATAIRMKWDNPQFFVPGGGWDNFFGNLSGGRSPEDPANATAYVLKDGNILWIGLEVNDRSVGASAADFWLWDGLTMSVTNRTRRGNPEEQENFWTGWNTDEFFFSWHDRYGAGDMPRLFGNLGDDRTVWDGKVAVNGTTNDDSDVDTGYTMELWIDVSQLGFDFTLNEGDRLPLSLAVYDNDFTGDPARAFLSRAWWQNPWGGDMPWGTGFIYGRSGVTVNSATVPEIPATDLTLPAAPDVAVTIDGSLDEGVWERVDPQVTLKYQMTAAEMDELPGFGPYYTSFYRPGGGEGAPPVIDASTGRFRMFFEGTTLYVGLDSDDQAISGNPGEDRTDGLRVILRTMENDTLGLPFTAKQFRVAIDSSGQALLLEDAVDNPKVTANVHLKGASTAADPSDIDEGYQIEMAIDLTTLAGYEDGLGDGIIWLAATYFDADYLDPEDQSTFTRTWFLAERGQGSGQGPGMATRLDPNITVAIEGSNQNEIPETLVLYGNYPNPFNPSTRIVYALPRAGEVSIEIFDLLGRKVATLAPGLQSAGRNEFTFEGNRLASGIYIYRVQLDEKFRATGRMMLLK
ncbi:MAG: sugar-binding protein [Rhodothermales bacterium]